MSHSNSSLSCYVDCPQKYNLRYIQNVEPLFTSVHLKFGTFAHKVLCDAGTYRDNNGPFKTYEDMDIVIPDENLEPSLKSNFSIRSWKGYFRPIIKQLQEYERKLMSDALCTIYREVKINLELKDYAPDRVLKDKFTGIIDLLIINSDNSAIILDYKFSTKRKTQDNFDLDSQLYLYTLFVHNEFGIPIRNIQIGYIDIPKEEFGRPVLLSNGTLSRAKSQNTSSEIYAKSVFAVHGDDPFYNCEPGGYYYDIYCELSNNKAAYLQLQYVDEDIYNNIIKDAINIAYMTERNRELNLPYIKKCDSYSCNKCEYLKYCKPYLYVDFGG